MSEITAVMWMIAAIAAGVVVYVIVVAVAAFAVLAGLAKYHDRINKPTNQGEKDGL